MEAESLGRSGFSFGSWRPAAKGRPWPRSVIAAFLLAGCFLSSPFGRGAFAAWPERDITIIVPFPAGGATDLLGRLLAAELSPMLGRPIIVENRVGDVGNVGIRSAARAASTGYTLIVVTNAMLINPAINPRLTGSSYDPLQDFSPISARRPTSSSPGRIRASPASPTSSPRPKPLPALSPTLRPASAVPRRCQWSSSSCAPRSTSGRSASMARNRR
jgi:hypothetical protein